jgi:hypothetical protein
MADLIYMAKTKWTALLDTIRSKGGTSTLMTADQAIAAVEAIETGGGGLDMDTFASTGFDAPVILKSTTAIRANAFAYQNLTEIHGESVTTINESAFDNCTSLTTIDFPNLTTVNGNYAFRKIDSCKNVRFPKLTTASGAGLFYQTRYGGTKQLTVVLPAIQTLGSVAFRQGNFVAVDLGPDLIKINSDCFYFPGGNGVVCTTCILRKTDGVVPAQSVDSINGLVDVFVPSALISAYESAANWSTRVSAGKTTFHAIEGSIYENAYADGAPIS